MISLNVYLTPKPGRTQELESAIRDKWIAAMAQQPGFISATMAKPFPDEDLAQLEATKPEYAYEVVSYWRSEEDRLAWSKRPIINEVWPPVEEASETLTYILQNVQDIWNL